MYWLTYVILCAIPVFLLIILYDRLTASDEDKATKQIVLETGEVVPRLSLFKTIFLMIASVLVFAVFVEIWNYIMC